MDFNLVVMSGLLAAPPDRSRVAQAGGSRLLLTVRSQEPMPRVDLLPVSLRLDQLPAGCETGQRIWVAGSLQRRFSATTGRSRIEVIAHHVERRIEDAPAP